MGLNMNKYFLFGGFSISDNIVQSQSSVNRGDLVYTPQIMNYRYINSGDFHFYVNTMNECVFICEYSEFASNEEMFEDYYDTEDIYKEVYKNLLLEIKNQFNINIIDTEWLMILSEGEQLISNNLIIVNNTEFNFNEITNNIEMVSLIDCAIIYQSAMSIGRFFRTLSIEQNLNKFQNYQLSFYLQELMVLISPKYFLTNEKEIEMFTKIYKEWKLDEQIRSSVEIGRQLIVIYDFAGKQNSNNLSDFSNLLMGYIGVVILYDPLIGLIQLLYPTNDSLDKIVKYFIMAVTIAFVYRIGIMFLKLSKDNRNYKAKTK